MKVHALTLAALATSAVPDLEIFEYEDAGRASEDEIVAALQTDLGPLLISFPTSAVAEVRHSSEILALTSVTQGLRENLPFKLPEVMGIAGIKESRAVVTTMLGGEPLRLKDLTRPGITTDSLARSLSALHNLPVHTLINQGVSAQSTTDIREEAEKLLERASQSGLLPTTLSARWHDVIENDRIWNFSPAVIHGGLNEEQIYVTDGEVSGIYDWHQLQISDPAEDLAWLYPFDSWENILQRYVHLSHTTNARSLAERAKFWHEFSIVRWLLYGIETRDSSIVDDAVNLFDQLIDQISESPETNKADSNVDEITESVDASLISSNFDRDSLISEDIDDFGVESDDEPTIENEFGSDR